MSMLNNFVPADLFVYMAGEENINKDSLYSVCRRNAVWCLDFSEHRTTEILS